MKNSYVIPALFTAALHGLFLGTGSPTVRPPINKIPVRSEPTIVWVTTPEVVIDPELGAKALCGGAPVGPPTLPEVVTARPVLTGQIAMLAEFKPTINSIQNITTLLPNWRPGDPGDHNGPGDGPSGMPSIVSCSGLDNEPTTKVQVKPAYPYALRAEGVDGEVLVDFWVDEKGFVHDPVARSSTRREFEEPTLAAVAKWRFAPGLKNGKAVRFRMSLPVRFSGPEI